MDLVSHGGECCGAVHLCGFHDWTEREIKGYLKDALFVKNPDYNPDEWDEEYKYFSNFYDEYTPYGTGSLLVEVCLTDSQLMRNNSALAKCLKKLGFRKGPRWYNPNSGNHVTMFTYSKKPKTKQPYEW